FPIDNPRNTRFSINFFTAIGMGVLTEGMREYLKNMPKPTLPALPVRAASRSNRAEDVVTHVQQRRQDAQSGIDPIRTQGRRLDRGLHVQDVNLPLLLFRVRELLSAGEDTHPPSPAPVLVPHLRDVARLVEILVRHHILARARLQLEELREDEATPPRAHLPVTFRHETEAIPARQHHLVDVRTVILDHLPVLSLVRALHHLEEQAQDVGALRLDLHRVLLRDEQDLRSPPRRARRASNASARGPKPPAPSAEMDLSDIHPSRRGLLGAGGRARPTAGDFI
ncbi:hypothetical protein KCU64_g4432, partial [Aureobasidium melanogenum]